MDTRVQCMRDAGLNTSERAIVTPNARRWNQFKRICFAWPDISYPALFSGSDCARLRMAGHIRGQLYAPRRYTKRMIYIQLFNRSENIQYDLTCMFYWYTARHASQAEH
jgi:hypothetical protein